MHARAFVCVCVCSRSPSSSPSISLSFSSPPPTPPLPLLLLPPIPPPYPAFLAPPSFSLPCRFRHRVFALPPSHISPPLQSFSLSTFAIQGAIIVAYTRKLLPFWPFSPPPPPTSFLPPHTDTHPLSPPPRPVYIASWVPPPLDRLSARTSQTRTLEPRAACRKDTAEAATDEPPAERLCCAL